MNDSVNELSSSGGSAGRFRFFGGVRRFGAAGTEIVDVNRRSGGWKVGRRRSRIDISTDLVETSKKRNFRFAYSLLR